MAGVARVLVDTGLSHLDREFDYLVPDALDAVAQPGVRVKVRFAGVLREGWLVERIDASEHRLAPIHAVVSAEPVLAPEIARLARVVADRWGGLATDVLRTAVPPRVAKVEREIFSSPSPYQTAGLSIGSTYPLLNDFVAKIDQGARASWLLAPGRLPMSDLANLVSAAGGGVLVVLPDVRDVERLRLILEPMLGQSLAVMTGELPTSTRYRNFLRIRRGLATVVIGTRSAVFAPLASLRLIIVVDDGDQSHEEPHAPGWNSRAVASLRSHLQSTALLFVGHTVSVETQSLVEQGWLGAIDPDTTELRRLAPRVQVALSPESARVPTQVWKGIKRAIEHGSVLVCAPLRGYQPSLVCERCRSAAECPCGGRIATASDGNTYCRLCARAIPDWRCPHCDGDRLRSTTIGAERLVEEFGRAHPHVPVVSSTGEHVVADDLSASGRVPRIVIATPGVEPVVAGGYAAVVILDADYALARPDLRVDDEARRRWFNALALATPGAAAHVVGTSTHPTLQALVSWAPRRAAVREREERRRLRLPPEWQLATLEGEDLETWRGELEDAGVEVLGSGGHLIARVHRGGEINLASLLKEMGAQRSSRKEPIVRFRIDPVSIEAGRTR